jgi:hypothetical protein
MVRGPASIPSALLRAAARSLRAMGGARRLSLLASVGLVLTLWAPWFSQLTVARGLTGSRRLRESFTGWDALPAAAWVCLVVAVVVWGVLLARSAAPVDGLGAAGRRAARARIDGIVVSALGLAAVAWLLGALVDHPAVHAAGVTATTTTSDRWGIAIALIVALLLTGLGVLIVRTAARAARPVTAGARRGQRGRRSRRDRPAQPRSGPAAGASPQEARPAPQVRASRGTGGGRDADPAPATDPAMPDFDFTVSDEPVPSAPRPVRRASG